MTFARTRSLYGGREWNMPSRFLDELPDELVERETQEPKRFQQTWETRQSVGTGSRFGGGAADFAHRGRGGAAAPQPREPHPGRWRLVLAGRRRCARFARRGRGHGA